MSLNNNTQSLLIGLWSPDNIECTKNDEYAHLHISPDITIIVHDSDAAEKLIAELHLCIYRLKKIEARRKVVEAERLAEQDAAATYDSVPEITGM